VFANYATFATTGLAWVSDYLASAAASSAGASHTEESLLIPKLPAASTSAACSRLLSVGCSGSTARIASLGLANGNLGALPEDRILQLDRDVGAQICATLCATAAATTAEGVAKSEEVAEDLAEILEGRSIETNSAASESRMTKAVVLCALLLIREDAVCLARLFEFFFRIFVTGIAIRVMLHRELAVGALQLLLGAGSAYT